MSGHAKDKVSVITNLEGEPFWAEVKPPCTDAEAEAIVRDELSMWSLSSVSVWDAIQHPGSKIVVFVADKKP